MPNQEAKNTYLANFNVTFSKDSKTEEPLLDYLDSIVYPAMTSDLARVYQSDKYFFDEVKILEVEPNEFILVGYFIKQTKVEIKSIYSNRLERQNQTVPNAPFSTFIIFLKNHRMIFIKNQRKESPNIKSFNATVRHILDRYVRNINNDIADKNAKLPIPLVNIIGLPSIVSIEEKLKSVETINQLILRLYPLNADIPESSLDEDLRAAAERLGSRTGNATFNSPKNKQEVARLISNSKGTTEPVMAVKYTNGSTGTLRNDNFTETLTIALPENSPLENTSTIAYQTLKTNEQINVTSEEHTNIFTRNLQKIRNLLTSR
jgi:hypothetical protein